MEPFAAGIVELLPDATLVVDASGRIVAWNRACEVLTGVPREMVLGKTTRACAEAFYGVPRPILLDLLDRPVEEIRAAYESIEWRGQTLCGEAFIPRLRGGRGARIWAEAAPLYDRNGRRCGAIEVVRDITERRQAERMLRESEEKYRTLFETAGDAILLMREDRFVECNARALAMFGCERERIIGASPDAFSPPFQPDGRPSREKALEKIRMAATVGPQTFEWEHLRVDGQAFPAEVSLNRVEIEGETLIQAIVRDITARRRVEAELALHRTHLEDLVRARTLQLERELAAHRETEEALRQSGRILRAVIDSIDAAIYVADMRSYELLLVNRYVRERLGDITGKLCWQALQRQQSGPCPFCTNDRLVDAAGRPTGVYVWEFQNTVTGQWFQCRDVAIPWNDGRLVRMEIATDVTDLHLARERAESADRLKSAFLATMSHELRTPLNSIIGFSGILLQGLAGPLNPEQAKQMGMVCSSAEHLLALINDVLDLSKIEAGQLALRFEPFDLRASIEKVVAAIRPQAEKKGLVLECEVPTDLDLIVSDRRRVEQVLFNLLSNAVKFTERGRVRVAASRGGKGVVVAVTDTGPGIREEDRERLFRPFSQIDTGTNRAYEGTGLGLCICQRLLERLGGSIGVRSEYGKGSTFEFEIPLRAEAP